MHQQREKLSKRTCSASIRTLCAKQTGSALLAQVSSWPIADVSGEGLDPHLTHNGPHESRPVSGPRRLRSVRLRPGGETFGGSANQEWLQS